MNSRYDVEDFMGPIVTVENEPNISLKLELTTVEHDRLIVALKRESYDPSIKAILQAVEEAKERARRE